MAPSTSDLHASASDSVQNGTLASKPLDINIASVAELRRVPGVSYTLAQAIVAYRNKSGKFQSTDELLRVAGMSPAKLSAIRPYVTVQKPTSSEF